MKPKDIRLIGILISILGLVFFVGSLNYSSRIGIDYYFFTIGIGIVVSGILITINQIAGIYTYLFTLAIIFIWSFIEIWPDVNGVVSRVFMPTLIGAYLILSVRKKLSGIL